MGWSGLRDGQFGQVNPLMNSIHCRVQDIFSNMFSHMRFFFHYFGSLDENFTQMFQGFWNLFETINQMITSVDSLVPAPFASLQGGTHIPMPFTEVNGCPIDCGAGLLGRCSTKIWVSSWEIPEVVQTKSPRTARQVWVWYGGLIWFILIYLFTCLIPFGKRIAMADVDHYQGTKFIQMLVAGLYRGYT